jgi:hypothetical protein
MTDIENILELRKSTSETNGTGLIALYINRES